MMPASVKLPSAASLSGREPDALRVTPDRMFTVPKLNTAIPPWSTPVMLAVVAPGPVIFIVDVLTM